jgi:hypothetical protein
MVTKRRISVFTVLTVLSVLCWFVSAPAGEAGPGAPSPQDSTSPPALGEVSPGLKTLYLATGAVSLSGRETAVICTSYAADPDLYPFNVVVEFYEKAGALRSTSLNCPAGLAFDASTRTRTVTTNPIMGYTDDCVVSSLSIGQGSLRVLAPKKQGASLLCTAQVLGSSTNPPTFSHTLDMTRTGKFKPPKDIPAP